MWVQLCTCIKRITWNLWCLHTISGDKISPGSSQLSTLLFPLLIIQHRHQQNQIYQYFRRSSSPRPAYKLISCYIKIQLSQTICTPQMLSILKAENAQKKDYNLNESVVTLQSNWRSCWISLRRDCTSFINSSCFSRTEVSKPNISICHHHKNMRRNTVKRLAAIRLSSL